MSATVAKQKNPGAVGLLRWLVVAIAVVPLFMSSDLDSVVPFGVRFQSWTLWVLCWVPALIYLVSRPERRPALPFLPIVGVLHGLYYALQLTLGADNTNAVALARLDARRDYELPIQLALIGWSCLLLGYYMTKMITPAKPLALPTGLSVRAIRQWGFRLLVGGLIMEIFRQTVPIPVVLRGAMHLAAMLSQVGMVLLIVLNVRGHLERRHRLVLYGGLSGVILLAIGTGSIANGVYASIAAVLAMWIGGQRVRAWWVLAVIPIAATFVALRGVAMDYRQVAWFTSEELPVLQRSQVLLGILAERVNKDGVTGAVAHGWEVVSTRSANMDLFADVVRHTPRYVPYWKGETYLSLIGMAVPRVLWPNKPQKQLGQAFGHRYGYLTEFDRSTSINLPYFVEFYCNFGAWGVMFGMLLIGVIYAVLEQRINAPRQPVLMSVCAIALLLPLINIESDFSLTFGGLLLNGVALLMVIKFVARTSQARARGYWSAGTVGGTVTSRA